MEIFFLIGALLLLSRFAISISSKNNESEKSDENIELIASVYNFFCNATTAHLFLRKEILSESLVI